MRCRPFKNLKIWTLGIGEIGLNISANIFSETMVYVYFFKYGQEFLLALFVSVAHVNSSIQTINSRSQRKCKCIKQPKFECRQNRTTFN